MSTIFHNQQYASALHTPAEQDARLATHIALYLRATQENDGRWKASSLAHELRYTCQALEALHQLNFQAFHSCIDSGTHWLINLGEQQAQDGDDLNAIRLHPSRFKTLARLGAFADEQVLADFAELCGRINRWGLLNGIMQDPLLGSTIVADCLLDLARMPSVPFTWQPVLDAILPAIQNETALWCANPGQHDRDRLINSVGDASYALDVLLRSGYLAQADPAAAAVYRAMLGEVERHEPNTPLSKATLYSAIQLGAHFSRHAELQAALPHFFRALRVRYDRSQSQREERLADLHPLVLRALLSCSGEQLGANMVGYMLDSALESINQSQNQREAKRIGEFEQLVRKRIKITIRNIVKLSGGISDARVFRVNYVVDANGLAVAADSNSSRFEIHSIVVKSGTRADLQQSLQRYQHLRPDIQPYFAQHSQQPAMLEASPSAPAYVILEDLTEKYVTLRQVFGDIDHHKLSANDRKKLAHITNTVANSLFDIYRRTRRSDSQLVGLQVSRLYLSRLDKSLIEMCRPERFPRLKQFFTGFWFGSTRYESIETYQIRLYRHLDALRPPFLTLMHGDCHSRNIMLDDCYDTIKLIDLDKLDDSGDYVMDIALLIEDAALFRRLFDASYYQYLYPEQVEVPAAGTHIAYTPFVSEAAALFQARLCEHLDTFAREHGDRNCRPRLWLATALYLLRMVSKADEFRTGAVLYVEAVRLLHVLVEHLETGRALPAIPIARTVLAPAAAAAAQAAPLELAPASDLEQFHRMILECAGACGHPIQPHLSMDGRSVRYFVEQQNEPYAMLDDRQPPRILLRCDPAIFPVGHPYVRAIRATGVFRTALRPPAPFDLAIVRALLLDAFSHGSQVV